MKKLWQHSPRGNIPELGADILQNCHHNRTQSAHMNELGETVACELSMISEGVIIEGPFWPEPVGINKAEDVGDRVHKLLNLCNTVYTSARCSARPSPNCELAS